MTTADDPTTRRSEDTPEGHRRRKLVLRSVLPGDDTSLELEGTHFILGRGEGCALQLAQTGTSRRHAEIERRGPVYSIRDLGSTNGTQVDGKPVTHAPLANRAIVRLGEWLGVVEEHDAEEKGPYHFRELAPGVWGGALLSRVLEPLLRAACTSIPIVLVGRTGTGKERFARALHALSAPTEPFFAVNCAAVPETATEAELLLAAGKGVLFLDELEELPLPVQVKLLRAFDTGELTPLGEQNDLRFGARVVAASAASLETLVAAGRLRADLAARLSGLVVTLPELSQRHGDVPSLFRSFLHKHSGGTAPPVSTKLFAALCQYAWPANVRELEQLARQLLAVHGLEPVLRRSHLPAAFHQTEPTITPRPSKESGAEAAERLAQVLQQVKGNVNKAATAAGMSRQKAYRLINSNRLGSVLAAAREDDPGGDDGRNG